MVDDSELDYIRTFLGKVHTAATAKQKEETGKIALIVDTQRIYVLPGELIAPTSSYTYTKRYKVQISETSEANLTTAINNFMIGIFKFNTRQAIAAYTRPSTMLHIELRNGSETKVNKKRARWDCEIILDIEWSTS